MVRSIWPRSALVPGSGRSFVPTSQVTTAHRNQPTMPPTTAATAPVAPLAMEPTPAARAEAATTAIAWPIAAVSASTSS